MRYFALTASEKRIKKHTQENTNEDTDTTTPRKSGSLSPILFSYRMF